MPDQMTTSDSSSVVSALQDLATVCRDSQEGYRTAAGQTSDQGLKSMFEELAQRRQREADELDRLIRQQGGEPASRSGSLSGQAHRMFVSLRAALTSDDRQSALSEVARGESYAEAAFDRGKRQNFTGEARDCVQRIHDSVKQSRDKIRGMLQEAGGETSSWGLPSSQKSLEMMQGYVTERPMTSSLIALGVGFAIGALTMAMTRGSGDGAGSGPRRQRGDDDRERRFPVGG